VLSATRRALEGKELPYTGEEPRIEKTPEGYNVRIDVLDLIARQMI
jgi:hypothetical protein